MRRVSVGRVDAARRSNLRSQSTTFAQFFRVALILCAASGMLVLNQRITSDELHKKPVQIAFLARGPGIVKTDSGNRGQNVNPVGLNAQLNYFIRGEKIFLCDTNGAEPKFAESLQKPFRVLLTGPKPVDRDHPNIGDTRGRRRRTRQLQGTQLSSSLTTRQTRATPCSAASGWRRSLSSIKMRRRSSGVKLASKSASALSASSKLANFRITFSTT